MGLINKGSGMFFACEVWCIVDLPQVDSLIFLVMTRYIGARKKLKRAKTPEINRINRAPKRERASKCRRQIVRRTLKSLVYSCRFERYPSVCSDEGLTLTFEMPPIYTPKFIGEKHTISTLVDQTHIN